MPPEDLTKPVEQKAPTHKTLVALVIIAVVGSLVVFAIDWFGISVRNMFSPSVPETLLPVSKGSMSPVTGSNDAKVAEIARLKLSGDLAGAIAAHTAVMQDPEMDANQRARAALYVSWARYYMTGNQADLIDDIEEMKRYAIDTNVSTDLRASLVNTIGGSYTTRDQKLFDAIYSGPVFEDFRVEDDATLSARKLYEWSYSLKPTAQSAVRIARWYIETSLFQKPVPVSKSEVTKRKELATNLMREARVLDQQERAALDNIQNSPDHMMYLYWYALESGYIARLKAQEFRLSYKQAWQDFFAEAALTNFPSIQQRMPYAHYFYANALFKVDNDRAAAAVELDKAVDAVNSDPNAATNQFRIFVANGGIWDGEIAYMRGISDTFDAFLDSVGK